MRGIPCSISSCSRAVSPFKELRTLRFAALFGPHGQSFRTIWIEMQTQWEIKRARWNLFRMSKETTQACNCCFVCVIAISDKYWFHLNPNWICWKKKFRFGGNSKKMHLYTPTRPGLITTRIQLQPCRKTQKQKFMFQRYTFGLIWFEWIWVEMSG